MKLEGDCKHWQGTREKTCAAGVELRPLAAGEDMGWCTRLPCVATLRDRANGPVGQCDKFAPLTAEEEADEDAIWDEIAKESERRFRLLEPVCKQIKKEHKRKDATGNVECPVCHGKLHWRHAGYNGHLAMKCETEDCVAFME